MPSFTFLLDMLGDPRSAQRITHDLKEREGLTSRADPAGMWLEVEGDGPLDEAFSERVAVVARRHGFEPRDRVGTTFVATIGADRLRERLQHEWLSRWATGLVFLLPALALHYLAPIIATNGRLIPNLIEGLLVGWSIIAAGWPVVYQGVLTLLARRMTPDLFVTVGLTIAFLAGAVQTAMLHDATVFHVAAYLLIAITTQRMILWRRIARLDGNAHLMLPSTWPLGLLLLAGLVVMVFDVVGGLAMLLATPAMIGPLAINRLIHPFGILVPVVLFVALLGVAPLIFDESLLAGRIEAAFGFSMIVAFVHGASLGTRGHGLGG